MVVHHLAIDGVSWRVLLEDLWRAYRQLRAGGEVVLGAKTTSFKSWADRLERYAGMRAMGYNRETAADKIHSEGGTLDNNEWRDAGELLKQRMGATAPKKGKRSDVPIGEADQTA